MMPVPRATSNIRYIRRTTRLSELVSRPGGLRADHAVAEASKHIEAMKDQYVAIVAGLIDVLGRVEADTTLSAREKLEAFEWTADRIINIAGTFELTGLEEAAMCLCDLARAMREREFLPEAMVAIPIRAIRFFSPAASTGESSSVQSLIEGLNALREHLDLGKPNHSEPAP